MHQAMVDILNNKYDLKLQSGNHCHVGGAYGKAVKIPDPPPTSSTTLFNKNKK